MSHNADPLFKIFEKHLFNALVEDESTDTFLERVVNDYINRLVSLGTIIIQEHRPTIETDLKEEVLEMYRKKTYGHYSLGAFRRAHAQNLGEKQEQAQPIEPIKTIKKARRQRAS